MAHALRAGALRAGELWQLDATDLARLIRLGRASAREATAACLARRLVGPRSAMVS
jgi:hypothetical protein